MSREIEEDCALGRIFSNARSREGGVRSLRQQRRAAGVSSKGTGEVKLAALSCIRCQSYFEGQSTLAQCSEN